MRFDIKTFFGGLIWKYFLTIRKLPRRFVVKLGFLGAKVIGISSSGNTLVELNKNYALGCKGTVIELPRDKMIYEFIKNRGGWELEDSEFLANGLRKASNQLDADMALLDIGANTGLVTLQALNLANTNNEVFLFEPIPRHVLAIKNNLKKYKNININSFALSDRNEKSVIFTEVLNQGNSSLLKSVVSPIGQIQTEIRLVDTKEYCDTFLTKHDGYIIKCDTQGMDALILSRIPNRIWEKVERAIIEVWALPEISDQDVTNLLLMCQHFKFRSWEPKFQSALELSEIREFWLGKSGNVRNLYFSKTLELY